jgi:hypothetical protein
MAPRRTRPELVLARGQVRVSASRAPPRDARERTLVLPRPTATRSARRRARPGRPRVGNRTGSSAADLARRRPPRRPAAHGATSGRASEECSSRCAAVHRPTADQIRSAVTTRFACKRSSIRRARWRGPRTSSGSESRVAVSVPRIANSVSTAPSRPSAGPSGQIHVRRRDTGNGKIRRLRGAR